MQSIYFDDYELHSKSAFNYVTHKMIEMVEQENKTVKDLSGYRWVIGDKVAKSIFPDKPSKIFDYDVVYEDPVIFYSNGINFEPSVINTKNCSNCRFGNDGICPNINACVKSSLESAPTHWKEMTDAQKVEKVMSNRGTKKLVGDISKGYHYIDTDMAYKLAESKHRAEEMCVDAMRYSLENNQIMITDKVKQAINGICGIDVSELYPKQMSQLPFTDYSKTHVKKEDKNMNIKLYMDEGFISAVVTNQQSLIKNVIFSGPCTIVQWLDGDKTIVRCENEDFDKEKGLAMAIVKKFFGTNKNKSNYNDIFKKWIPEEEEIDKTKEPVKETVYMSVKQYANMTGMSKSTIIRQINIGKIFGAKKDETGKWLIPVGEV